MMLERVTEYLTAIEDFTRLDLVRRCFYLKVCEKLSRERACVGWRREVLSQLVKEWNGTMLVWQCSITALTGR